MATLFCDLCGLQLRDPQDTEGRLPEPVSIVKVDYTDQQRRIFACESCASQKMDEDEGWEFEFPRPMPWQVQAVRNWGNLP